MESKFAENLVIWSEIKDFSEKYSLGALITNDNKYTSAWLEFVNKGIDSWDRSEYLYNALLPVLRKLKSQELLSYLEEEELREVKLVIPEEDLMDVLEILERGDSLGFFDEFKHH